MPFGKKQSELQAEPDTRSGWREEKSGKKYETERIHSCYDLILKGGTRKQVLDRHSLVFNITHDLAILDYEKALHTLIHDQEYINENLKEYIQAMRLVGIKKALERNNLQAFAMLLKDLGAVINETDQLTVSEMVNLKISIEGESSLRSQKLPEAIDIGISESGRGNLPELPS